MDWIQVAQYGVQWRVFVTRVINLRLQKKHETKWQVQDLQTFQTEHVLYFQTLI
jgi:hypothetical protein